MERPVVVTILSHLRIRVPPYLWKPIQIFLYSPGSNKNLCVDFYLSCSLIRVVHAGIIIIIGLQQCGIEVQTILFPDIRNQIFLWGNTH